MHICIIEWSKYAYSVNKILWSHNYKEHISLILKNREQVLSRDIHHLLCPFVTQFFWCFIVRYIVLGKMKSL